MFKDLGKAGIRTVFDRFDTAASKNYLTILFFYTFNH